MLMFPSRLMQRSVTSLEDMVRQVRQAGPLNSCSVAGADQVELVGHEEIHAKHLSITCN